MREIIASLFIAQFINILDFMVMMPLGPVFMREFSLTPHEFSFLISVYSISCAVAGLAAFAFLDTFDRRHMFIAAFLIFIFSNLCCGVSHTYSTLLIARGVAGFAGGVLESAVFTLVGDLFPPEKRGTITGKIVAAFSLASLIGVPAGLSISAHFGWRIIFFSIVIIGLLGLSLAYVSIPSITAHIGVKRTDTDTILEQLYKIPNSIHGLFFVVFLMIGVFIVVPFIGSAMILNGKIPESSLGFVYMAGGAASIFATPFCGKLADRIGRWRSYVLIAPIAAVVLGLVIQVSNTNLLFACCLIALSMSFNGGRTAIANTIINDIPPPHLRGAYMSIKSSVQYIGGAIAAYLSGIFVYTKPDGTLDGLALIGIVSVLFSFISIYFARIITRHKINIEL